MAESVRFEVSMGKTTDTEIEQKIKAEVNRQMEILTEILERRLEEELKQNKTLEDRLREEHIKIDKIQKALDKQKPATQQTPKEPSFIDPIPTDTEEEPLEQTGDSDDNGLQDDQKEEEGGYYTADGGFISTYGYGHEPKKQYRVKRPRRKIPRGGDAPFESQSYTGFEGLGGQAHVPPRGFQQEKVARRGNIRRNVTGPAFPNEENFSDRLNRMDSAIEKLRSGEGVTEVFDEFQSTISRGGQFITNPQQAVSSTVLRLIGGLGPYGAAVVAAITAIIIAPEVIAQIIKTLAKKGLLLNRDWRREMEDEVNALFNQEEKKRRLLGLDTYIVTQTDQYEPESGSETVNNLENRDEVIISNKGAYDKAIGIR